MLPRKWHRHSPESLQPAVSSGSLVLWLGLDCRQDSIFSGMHIKFKFMQLRVFVTGQACYSISQLAAAGVLFRESQSSPEG